MRIVVYSDIHSPFQDNRAVKVVNDFCQWFKPHTVILIGDVADFYAISKFDKSPRRSTGNSFFDEMLNTRRILKSIREANPKASIIYIVGNHEFRLRKFLNNIMVKNPSLATLFGLSGIDPNNILRPMLHLAEVEIKLLDLDPEVARFTDNFIRIGDLFIGHWDRANKHSAYTAKNLLADKGVNLIQGHTHRVGTHIKSTLGGILEAHEIGCLCNLQPQYTCKQDWQHGFAIVEGDKDMKQFTVHNVLIKDYRFRFAKRIFQG